MTFSSFCITLEKIESTTLRNKITEYLAQLFVSLEPMEIVPSCWLLLGRVFPQYEGIEFQFADKMIIRSLSVVSELSTEEITSLYKVSGDLGETAQKVTKSRATQKQPTVIEVYEDLKALCLESGKGSQDRKILLVTKLLSSLDPIEIKYIIRIILSKLRLGFSDMTILDALSWAIHSDKSARKALEDAYQNKHDIGKLAQAFLLHQESGIKHFDIELGIPIQPALCQRLKTPVEMIEKMGKVIVESKYDGTRVQIHIRSNIVGLKNVANEWRVRTFTRSLEESSAMFPELVGEAQRLQVESVILDCEAVGFDPNTGKLVTFQETIQRKRKYDVDLFSKQIPLRFFVFDILYLNGKSLIDVPLIQRKTILHKLLLTKGVSSLVESGYIVTDSADELRQFHKERLDLGLEGAVIKQYESIYQPGRKGFNWVKFKEEESAQGKLSDTIDAVVMGYWYGKGKRTGFGIGAFLIGIQGSNERILTLSKVGTGLSDEQWIELKAKLFSATQETQPQNYVVNKQLSPDVWVRPEIIVEVAGDELTNSPTHSAGLALRFPRLVRFREDKNIQQITQQSELKSIS